MSKSSCGSSGNILNLMPHIVEDYCRIKNVGQKPSTIGRLRYPERLKKFDTTKKRKIQIELLPDCGKEQQEQINKKLTCPRPRKPRKNVNKSKSCKSVAETNSESPLERRKKYTQKRLMKPKSESSKETAAFERLAEPKLSKCAPTNPPWTLTGALKNFQPSERLIELAKNPISKALFQPTVSEVLKVKPSTLTYNATPRIQELANPKWPSNDGHQWDPFKVSPAALRAKLSERQRFLAYPKRREDRLSRKNPFKVKKQALYAKPSKLIKKLAKPKVRWEF